MDNGLFKMKKFAADAGTLFNRAVQVRAIKGQLQCRAT